MPEPRIYWTCSHCGSMNLRWDAYVAWNIHKQINEEAGNFDSCFCVNCEGETGCNDNIIADDDFLFSVEFVHQNGKYGLEETVVAKSSQHAVRLAMDVLSNSMQGCRLSDCDYDTIKIYRMEIRDERTPLDAPAD